MINRSEKKAIQDDPHAFFHRISVNEDSSFLLGLIEACTTEHWPALHGSNILSVIQHVCQKPEDMLNGLKMFLVSLKLVSWVELEDDERSYSAVVSAFQAAQTIFQVLWRELERTPRTRVFRLLDVAHQLVHCIAQLGIGDEYQDHFRDLINLSPIIFVSMHICFYVRNSAMRHQANLDRLSLVFRDSPGGCYARIKEYLDGADPEALSKQLDIVIKASDIDEGSLIEYFAFLMYLEEKHPTRVHLELYGLEANFVLLLHRIVDSDIAGYDVQIASIYQANKLLEKLMEHSATRIGCLHEIFRVQDGASLMADVALMVSQTWSPTHHILRRPSLFFDSHQQFPDPAVFNKPRLFLLPQILQILSSNPPVNSPDMPALLSILLKSLRPIWHRVLSHLRSLDSNRHPGAPQVTKMWISLGTLVGVNKLVQSLIGCSSVECPRFVKETNEEMAVCTRCDGAQYCDEKCQKRDWKAHKLICRPVTKVRTSS